MLGKQHVTRLALTCLLSEELLLEDVPGAGKTQLARALPRRSRAATATSSSPRPAPERRHRRDDLRAEQAAPSSTPALIFATIVLADEINRASPNAVNLLEVMEEGRVTIDGTPHSVGEPFLDSRDAEPHVSRPAPTASPRPSSTAS